MLYDKRITIDNIDNSKPLEFYQIEQKRWMDKPSHEMLIQANPENPIINKLEKAQYRLKDIAYVSSEGIKQEAMKNSSQKQKKIKNTLNP